MFRKNTASQFIHFQGVDATTGGIKAGVTWTMRRCIDGTFAAGGGTVTEDGSTGWYKCALAQADTNGNNIGFNFTGTGAVPQTVNIITDGSPPDVNLKNAAGTAVTLDANNVLNVSTKYIGGTLQTARDIGLSVLLSSGTGTGQLSFTSGILKVDVDTIKTNPVVNGGTVTFPTTATLASTTNITAGTITTVTTVTNQLTAAAIATGVWQDATAGDFTTASSIGKALYVANIVPGAAGGHFIAGTNAATTITTGLTTHFIGTVDTVTTYTGNTPQTGDNYARLGAPVGASISADIAAAPAAVWAVVIDGTNSAIKLMRGFAAALMGKASGLATTSAKYRNTADSKDVIAATVDADGNRSAVTLDLT